MANTLFGMMNSSTTGLMTSQAAINITGNNISNINTVGYTRQRVAVGNSNPLYFRGTGYLGTGVQVKDIQRIRDQYLDVQIRNETSTLKEFEAKNEIMDEIQAIFNEPSETGLNAIMTNMWNSWEELSKNADNSTMQTLVKENSQVVADQLNHFMTQLDKTISDIEARQEIQTNVAADLIQQLNDTNKLLEAAYKNDPTKSPNELLDQRDLLAKQLSEYLPVEVTYNSNHTVSISTTIQTGDVDVLSLDQQGIKDVVPELKTGVLKGYEDSKGDVEKYQHQLDEYTKTLATSINEIQVKNGGEPIFVYDDTNAAGSIQLNPDLENIIAGTSGSGDGSVALEILKLRDEKITIDGTETKFDQYYKNLIGDVGVKAQHAESMVKGQETLLGYLEDKYESTSGVSLDEETINLIQFQKAYDANAKVISTITDMLDTIINGLGV